MKPSICFPQINRIEVDSAKAALRHKQLQANVFCVTVLHLTRGLRLVKEENFMIIREYFFFSYFCIQTYVVVTH